MGRMSLSWRSEREGIARGLGGRPRNGIVELRRNDAHLVVRERTEHQVRLHAATRPEARAVGRVLTAGPRVAELLTGLERIAPAHPGRHTGRRLASHLHRQAG